MQQKILNHYLQTGIFTNAGCYANYFKTLPDDIKQTGLLIRKQLIHRTTLKAGNVGTNKDLRFGDMKRVPWWRLRCEDDILPTAASMLAELFRRDPKGIHSARKAEHKLVVTCRYTTILVAAILKSKGIPCRARSGFASYFLIGDGRSWDHWINEYWNVKEKRWVAIDIDGCMSMQEKYNPFDLPQNSFDYAAPTWLAIRNKKTDEKQFVNASGHAGWRPVMWAVFYDFHCLMNNELIYNQCPAYVSGFDTKIPEKELKEIDELAKLMLNPDENFDKLKHIWETKKKYRKLVSPLVSAKDWK
ncbi:hypothetical protein COV18_03830 [Candidatus Woesearchaeota archaeon CG10_big_fil_rev_8_21_14_0_10_37_12]|nr:MAG: hypothetical protein COV18_03830 [Candidatus Woesearchaeota archaeon CG10_big_fil_rev_8_21_14_0_10_37_12]